MKKCSKCKEIKELKGFYKDKNKKDGLCYHCKSCHNKYRRDRRKHDEVFKELRNQSKRVRTLLKRKTNKVDNYIGLNKQGLIDYLNDNEYNFKYGDKDIEIDHIVPLSSAKTVEEVQELNHYTNIQLLPSYFNQHIKRNRTDVSKEELIEYLMERESIFKK